MMHESNKRLNSNNSIMTAIFLLIISLNFNGNIYTQTTISSLNTSQFRSATSAQQAPSTPFLPLADFSSQQKSFSDQIHVHVASINGFTLQLMMLFVLICIISLLLLSIQAFVAYDKFQQLYGDELSFGLIVKNLFKTVFVRFMVFKQMRRFFNKGKNIRQSQHDLLKQFIKHYNERNTEYIKPDENMYNTYVERVSFADKHTANLIESEKNFAHNEKLNKKALSLNVLNWLVERPVVFYGDFFSFHTYAMPYKQPHEGLSLGSGYCKFQVYASYQTPMKLYEHGVTDEDFCCYIQTIYALSRTSITVMHCVNLYILYKAFNLIINDWYIMCDSIEAGIFLFPPQIQFKLDSFFQNNMAVVNRFRHEKLTGILKPNIKRANELRHLFRRLTMSSNHISIFTNDEALATNTNLINILSSKQHFDSKGLAIKVWPNLEYVISTMSGTLNCQLGLVRDYLSKTVKIISHMHVSDKNLLLGYSMQCFNVDGNTQSEEPFYINTYDQLFFEFIDMNRIKLNNLTNDCAITLDDVQQDKEYEIVVTNNTVCRYRTGHIVKFHRTSNQKIQIPLYTFQYTLDNVLQIDDIYLDEKIILKKLNLISQLSKCLIVDYTTCVYNINRLDNQIISAYNLMMENNMDDMDADSDITPTRFLLNFPEQEFYRKAFGNTNLSCFILFIEFKAILDMDSALKTKLGISDLLDEYICYSNKEYALARKQSRIDKFRVYELRTGAFETYKSYLINEKFNRTGKTEYETPRKLTDFYDINLLFNLRLE